jgi:hypothetical protein
MQPGGWLLLCLMLAALSACGPQFAPGNAPAAPCEEISAAEFEAAIDAGAARATAKISEGGVVSMETGPGRVHCATYDSSIKPCRRPNDFVIQYNFASGETMHVRVPANTEYRFRLAARPTTCEIVLPPEFPE